ncbi:MAG: hypothetical protein ACYTCU_08475 [Planctomycetota bacterium]
MDTPAIKEPPPVSLPPPDSPLPPIPPTPGPPQADQETHSSPLGAVGTVLIVFAALLVLHVLELLPMPFVFTPLLLVYIGFRGVRHTEGPARVASIVFMAVGVLAQIGIFSEMQPGEFGLLAPIISASGNLDRVADRVEGIAGLIVLGIGIYMIRRHHLRAVERAAAGSDAPGTGPALHSDVVNLLAIFSGSERRMASQRFAGGRVTTIFGGAELDLRDCEMEAAEARLHMACIFGGAVLRVPAHWDVIVEAVPIFGGIGTRGAKKARAAREPGEGPRGRLVVTGAAIFGGIDVKVS